MDDTSQIDLSESAYDHSISILKAYISTTPILGPILAECFGVIWPNQRIDRVVSYLQRLEAKLDSRILERIREVLVDERREVIFTEGIKQASDSTSDERREYIALLVAEGITSEEADLQDQKYLLETLGKINDNAIVMLKSHATTYHRDRDFHEANKALLTRRRVSVNAAEIERQRKVMFEAIEHQLVELNLLEYKYAAVRNSDYIDDKIKKATQRDGVKITQFGRLLLQHIGQLEVRNE